MRCCSSVLHIGVAPVLPSPGLVDIQNAFDIGRDDSSGDGNGFGRSRLPVDPVNPEQRHWPSGSKRESEAMDVVKIGNDYGSEAGAVNFHGVSTYFSQGFREM